MGIYKESKTDRVRNAARGATEAVEVFSSSKGEEENREKERCSEKNVKEGKFEEKK